MAALLGVSCLTGCFDFHFDLELGPSFGPPDADPCGGHGSSVERLNDCDCPLTADLTTDLDGTPCDKGGLICQAGWFGARCTCEPNALQWYCGGLDMSIPTPLPDLASLDD